MSDSHLPADPRHWPTDPFRLLAVDAHVDSRELRKAYTRLTRKFKPEHHPEEFRRIRDAYESAQQMLQWRSQFATNDVPSAAPSVAESAPVIDKQVRSPREEEPANQPNKARRLLKSLDDELEEAWALACGDKEAEAYEKLRSLIWDHSSCEAVFVRLYWLLKVSPHLDGSRKPVSWLMTPATCVATSHTLRELLRREVEKEPSLALSSDYGGLLRRDVPSPVAYMLLTWRWQAAMRLAKFQLVQSDLERLRPRLQTGDPFLWSQLLVQAASLLAWMPEIEPTQLYAQIEQCADFQFELQGELDRLDVIRQMTQEWRALRLTDGPRHTMVKLMASVWRSPPETAQQLLLQFAANCVGAPEEYLAYFDGLRTRAPFLLVDLAQRLAALGEPVSTPEAEIKTYVYAYLQRYPTTPYVALRKDLLWFCIHEGIHPGAIIASIDDTPSIRFRGSEDLAELLRQDVALRCVCSAHDAIWT